MYQKIIIVGNLGRDPETRELSGNTVTNFSVATSRSWTSASGEKKEETVWFRVAAWGRLGETCAQFLAKGRKVLVEGALQPDLATGGPRTFTRQDGTVSASFEIRAITVQFLSGKNDDAPATTTSGGNNTATYEEDDIPF